MKILKHFGSFRVAASLALALGSAAGSQARADAFTVTYLAPGVQTPTGITTYYENFNDVTLSGGTFTTNFNGSNITGTYSGNFEIFPADIYGGAAGTGDYLVQKYHQTATLTLSQSVNYFGLWFSALDTGNELQFYKGDSLVYTYTNQDFIAGVGACPSTSGYCGNPNDGYQDHNQQYAYINLYDTSGSFNKVVFSEGPGGNFESDNNAIANVTGGTKGTVLGATPEPGSLVLLGTGLCSLATLSRRVRGRLSGKSVTA